MTLAWHEGLAFCVIFAGGVTLGRGYVTKDPVLIFWSFVLATMGFGLLFAD